MGLQLSLVHHAGNMRMFHFGKITQTSTGTIGQFAMHAQCPWRIRQGSKIITGFHDWYEPAVGFEPPDHWEPSTGNSLQEEWFRFLFNCSAEDGGLLVNRTNNLVVTSVAADSLGGCKIALSGGCTLEVFPCASVGEAWRLFEPDKGTPHFVVELPIA